MHTFEAHCSCPVPQLRQVLSVVLGDPDGLWDPDGYWQMWQMYKFSIMMVHFMGQFGINITSILSQDVGQCLAKMSQ